MNMILTIVSILILTGSYVSESAPVKYKPAVQQKAHPKEISVMIIDTGISKHSKLNPWVKRINNKDYVDNHGHGTHVAGIVLYGTDGKVPLCKQVKIYSCKYFDPNVRGEDNLKNEIKCIKRATALGIKFINISGGGTDYSKEEYDALKEFVDKGGVVTAAAGNERSDLRERPFYPASYNYIENSIDILVAENVDANGNTVKSSNSHPYAFKMRGNSIVSTLPNESFGTMSGSSQASAELMHIILKQQCEQLNSKK